MDAAQKARLVQALQQHWDIIIIGGGITGAAVLLESSRAGLRSLLLEQRDFAWGTSSRSGKWVHGGLRYMKQGQIKVTYDSVREREKLCREFAGLITMKPMHWLFFKGHLVDEWLIRTAIFVYDLLAGKHWRRHVTGQQLQQAFPGLEASGLKSALCFYEGQTDDARMTLRVIQEAHKFGGVALNYTPVVGLEKVDGLVRGVHVPDDDGNGTVCVQGSQVIAATGVWSDLMRQHIQKTNTQKLRPLRGSHLIFDRKDLPVDHAVVLEHPIDKRPGFITPFQGRVLVGNTDLDHRQDLGNEASITADEVTYLLGFVQHYFPSLHVERSHILSTFSGVRPVLDSGKANPSSESRDHVVWQEDELITIGGGKLTTFQHIALDALMRVRGKFPQLETLRQKHSLLQSAPAPLSHPGLTPEQNQRMTGRYGDAAARMVQDAGPSDLALVPGTETHWIELAWCAAKEEVMHLDDLLLRRTRVGLLLRGGGVDLLGDIRAKVQSVLQWSDARWDAEVTRYLTLWTTHYSVPEIA